MDHNWTIYMYTFPNGKRYVGATKRSLHLRQGSRESGWSRYKNYKLLWDAIQEFGVERIEQTVLFKGVIPDEEAAEMERYFISLYKTNANRYSNPSYGYNSADGGEGTQQREISEERKLELASQMRELAYKNRGRNVSAETRRRQRDAKLGSKRGPMSDETKIKISRANSLENLSEEKRQHKSESKMKPVIAYDPITGNRLVFGSGDETASFFGVRSSAVSRWLNGTRNPTNGYQFTRGGNI